MKRGISMETRKELIKALAERYHCNSRSEKKRILDEFLCNLSVLWLEGEARPTHRGSNKVIHNWRTRKDPFEKVLPKLLHWLEAESDITSKDLLERLYAEHTGEFIPN